MLRNILKLKGTHSLSKSDQKSINGSGYYCPRGQEVCYIYEDYPGAYICIKPGQYCPK